MENAPLLHPDSKGKNITMKHSLKAIGVLVFVISSACGNNNTSKTSVSSHSDTLAVHYPNTLAGTQWIIANYRIIGYNQHDTAAFELHPFDTTVFITNFSAIRFTDSTHYESYNSWECGNDCFITVNGTYAFTKSNEVSFYVDSIQQTRECGGPTIHPKEKLASRYILQKTGTDIKLLCK
jgi:hypothetical protein